VASLAAGPIGSIGETSAARGLSPFSLPVSLVARAYDETSQQDPTVVVYRISGAFFFGPASIGAVLERIGDAHRNLIIDFIAAPFVDSTGARTIEDLAHKAAQRGVDVDLTGVSAGVRRELAAQGVRPLVKKAVSIDRALAEIRGKRPGQEAPAEVS
jgi:SulP family sulfate permease